MRAEREPPRRSEFRLILLIVSAFTLGAGIGAGVIAMFGGSPLNPALQDLFNALIWVFIGGCSALLMLLGAHLELG